jgi:hypothetical protein
VRYVASTRSIRVGSSAGQFKDDVPLVRLEDDLRLALFAHGPPEGAPVIVEAAQIAKLADPRSFVALGCGRRGSRGLICPAAALAACRRAAPRAQAAQAMLATRLRATSLHGVGASKIVELARIRRLEVGAALAALVAFRRIVWRASDDTQIVASENSSPITATSETKRAARLP